MKKRVIPVIIAIVLIIFIVAISVGVKLMDKYSYSKERADLEEYFSIRSLDEVAIVLGDELIEESARLMDGAYYFDLATVHKYLNDRFYVDENEQLLLYTLPRDTVRTVIGSSAYTTKDNGAEMGVPIARYAPSADGSGETLYIAADYVKLFTDFSYRTFTGPNRMQVYTKEYTGKGEEAYIAKDTAVRYQGGVKSPILTEVVQGDSVTVLEEMENWSKVKTGDAFIGYVENKRLEKGGGSSLEIEAQPQEGDASANVGGQSFLNPEFTSISRPYKINLAWHAVAGTAGNDTLVSVLEKTEGVNVISPTWFALTNNAGDFSSFASKAYVEKAHSMGLEVWGLIDNFSNPDVDTYEVLSYTSKRAYLIDKLVQTALEYDLDGINIDFEGLSQDTGEHFIQFIRELSVLCRENGIVLSVDNYVPMGYTDHYNRGEQGVFADYVIIMGYDEHYNGSPEAGSVASIGFVEDGIRKTVEQVPAEKVINAVPFYTRIWKSEGANLTSEAVGMEMAEQFVSNHNIEVRWDETTCQNYGEIQEGGVFYQVWLEDEHSIEAKLNIMEKYHIAGVASWKLGFEKPSIWEVIGNYLNQ
ncbi:MAG: SH3 domain-containing protein [Lachnospiraceae bacterium]|jgi:spore germination protein YaaH|nr:SH3 domain-containing protein [Lachnospiraceae bacterium]